MRYLLNLPLVIGLKKKFLPSPSGVLIRETPVATVRRYCFTIFSIFISLPSWSVMRMR